MEFYRKIYKLNIAAASPLAISSGAKESTDKDVIIDCAEKPVIPATSLAGVLRSYIEAKNDAAFADSLFGYVPTKDDDRREMPSKIMVYDGLYYGDREGFFITTRDMVALENKVGKNGAKFDMQAVETGTEFTVYIELLDKSFHEALESALAAMNTGVLRLGSKTSRGYGQVSLRVYAKEILSADEWFDFDMMDESSWNPDSLLELTEAKEFKITVGLKLTGGISIREYTTEPSTDAETAPDYRQMALHNGNRTPVIPGTSWAGAFRARFAEFCNDDKITKELFGFVVDRKKENNNNGDNAPKDSEEPKEPENSEKPKEPEAKKSNILFSESELSAGVWKKTTRNAIDRFTGGTKAGALYTEETYYGGNTELVISFREKPGDAELKMVIACLADLHNGLLAVGGLTSVGRGLFEINSINGVALSEDEKRPGNIFAAITKEACK